MRSFMRGISLGEDPDESIPESVGMDAQTMYEMYRLMAIAKYSERYVIPKAHVEQAHDLEEMGCSLDFDGGPGMQDSAPFGEASGRPVPVAVETFNALRDRQTSDTLADNSTLRGRVNLLNWDGNGAPPGLFPEKHPSAPPQGPPAKTGSREEAP
jgi:nitrate reductase beta subunit